MAMNRIDHDTARGLGRRQALQRMGVLAVGGVVWAGCGSGDEAATSSTTSTTSTTAAPSTTTTAAPSTTTTAAAETSAVNAGWASGGTDLISVPFPDDQIFEAAGACPVAVTAALTEGPCYYEHDVGPDISAGLTGLPMQLSLRLIDGDCQPIADHVVEVWHCDTRGLYSGDTSQSADAERFGVASDFGIELGTAFCTDDDPFSVSTTYFRGKLTTDAGGRVDFLTCFPGWYAGRTLHIHVAVSDPSGERRIISQLTVPDELVTEIFTAHELYVDRGDQDTPLSGGTDRFFPATGNDEFIMSVERNTDGTMLAYHNIQVA